MCDSVPSVSGVSAQKRKALRNRGCEYSSYRGVKVPRKEFKNPVCGCGRNCNSLISQEDRKSIFSRFWELGIYSVQNAYLSGLVKRLPVKQRRPRESGDFLPKGPRSVSYKYVLNVKNQSICVCKNYFLGTFNISNGRLQRCLKKEELGRSPGEDLRGKNSCPTKTSDVAVEGVKEHISLFPKYTSHYTRAHNPNRKYLSPELNLRKMYELYKEYCDDKKMPPEVRVKEHTYRKIFNNDFNLSFHAPRKDTCAKCDKLTIKLSVAANEEEKASLSRDHELHLRKAEKARKALKDDTEHARESDGVMVVTFDLQKALAFPKLTTSNAYYKRNMYAYNLGVHHTPTGESFMYVWDETVASRGSQEVGSCILKHIELHCSNFKHLIAYSDACTGQNRNLKLSLIWKTIVEDPGNEITQVDHKFMVSGHSFLPNDRDFGHIEKAAKFASIFTPADWIRVITNARRKKPFIVHKMEQSDFVSTKYLEKSVTRRKQNTNGISFKWLHVQWLRFNSGHNNFILYKELLNELVDFSRLDISKASRRGRPRSNPAPNQLTLLYDGLRPVTSAKKKDMLELLQWIPPDQYSFFLNLKTYEETVDTGPLSEASDDE